MSAGVFGGLTLKDLALRTWREIDEDKCLGRAAELGFFFMMALFPLLIFLISLLSFIPGSANVILAYLAEIMPDEAMAVVDAWVKSVFSSGSKSLLSFSLLFSIWAASTGMAALMDVLNIAYEVGEGRPFWKARLVAIALTLSLSLLVVGGAAMITFGDRVFAWALSGLDFGASFGTVWTVINYIVGVAMLVIGVGVIYYFGPNVKQDWRRILPGIIFAVSCFILVSFLFSLYLKIAPSYDATYGSLGAVIVLMFWLYLMSLVIMVGGEINSEIDQAAGKPKVEKERPRANQQS